ncbi:zinc metallochaperone AztD [Glaciihabitans tibetensis]|uniref:zinc metallochaperone AztD n=1 Tax=Glaciihabitans tibetensis TaxID=1266600 RepID=UPI001FEBE730|nr:zinc metallochaperone AztD [Glaciihabitans tibetensis]
MKTNPLAPSAASPLRRRLPLAALVATTALLLSACASSPASTSDSTAPSPDASDSSNESSASARVALTYDGGIYVLDAESLELIADLPLEGFNRLNPAGDGRNVMISTTEGFQVLDTATPEITDLVFDAPTPGHVVRHGDKTILFSDGTGDAIIYETADLLDSGDELPVTEIVASEAAHHGVAIALEDGTFLSTLGTSEGRTGVRALDSERTEIARNEECPSVHGEGAAQNEIAVFGCSDGVLVYDNGEFTKIQAADTYGRTGNEYVSETSPLTVGDYNADPDSEGYLLTQLVVTDTVAKTSTVVDMPAGVGYTWRDVARGPEDLAWVLGSDGSLHVLDPATGDFTDESYPVISEWEGPVEWQDAHPALTILGDTAYVTEPATNSIHKVDLTTGEVVATTQLDGAPIEIAVVTG